MFRLSNLLKSTIQNKEQRSLNGSILIWNFTNRCNLSCFHCYSKSSLDESDTLTTQKIIDTIKQLKRGGIEFVIFSGGEPLTRRDIFDIADAFKKDKIATYLSTNGLYINPNNVEKIINSFNYIGISIDGTPNVHDRFRGLIGAYDKSMKAIDLIHNYGGKVGIRFTITKETYDSLSHIFEISEEKGINKIYISHLVYSGRGLDNLKMDITKEQRKEAVEFIINKAFEYYEKGIDIDIVTGNMEMDAIFFMEKFSQKYPHLKNSLEERLKKWGGNSAGKNLVNINSEGDVRPDPFFPIAIGNIYKNSFDEIWLDEDNRLLERLREHPRKIGGKCKDCEYIDICNGGSRSRAWAIYGDLWAEDPSCYI